MNKLLVRRQTRDAVGSPVRTSHILLRLLRAKQPISRTELATHVGFNRSSVTSFFKPLIADGIVREQPPQKTDGALMHGRPRTDLVFDDTRHFFVGLNLGVRHSQVGASTLNGEVLAEEEFETPSSPSRALSAARKKIERLCSRISDRTLSAIGVSVPGLIDSTRGKLLYAPNLDWNNVAIADAFEFQSKRRPRSQSAIPVVVENDATAAAMYEAHLKMRDSSNGLRDNFIVIRSGTGIGVGLVLDGEVYRGKGRDRGIAGEFGHMTIIANGKPCVCGNRGCWEKYASASSASALYSGDRTPIGLEEPPRFVEIVARAEAGDIRARRTLERLGEYLGIGIANVILGIGVSHVIISGRLVYGWNYIEAPLKRMIERSIVGKLPGWTIACGEPKGSAFGGAVEVAIEEFLANYVNV